MHPIKIPTILTANTFKWIPGMSDYRREFNQKNRLDEVQAFLMEVGMDVTREGSEVRGTMQFEGQTVTAVFSYSEGRHVEKRFAVHRDGVLSNIKTIERIAHRYNVRQMIADKLERYEDNPQKYYNPAQELEDCLLMYGQFFEGDEAERFKQIISQYGGGQPLP